MLWCITWWHACMLLKELIYYSILEKACFWLCIWGALGTPSKFHTFSLVPGGCFYILDSRYYNWFIRIWFENLFLCLSSMVNKTIFINERVSLSRCILYIYVKIFISKLNQRLKLAIKIKVEPCSWRCWEVAEDCFCLFEQEWIFFFFFIHLFICAYIVSHWFS
jgi:hypothetical protein